MTEGLPIGTYNIIYADPPWRYEQRKVQGAAENHYPTTDGDLPLCRELYHGIVNAYRSSSEKGGECR